MSGSSSREAGTGVTDESERFRPESRARTRVLVAELGPRARARRPPVRDAGSCNERKRAPDQLLVVYTLVAVVSKVGSGLGSGTRLSAAA